MPERGKSQLQEVIARARLIEQSAEENKQKYETRRHPKRHTKDAFGGQPHVAHGFFEGRALPLHHLGQAGP